uniref:E3 ubiquitin-protein ligase At1g63170-like n=1 Tax=Erigeron canadensis TaxID=72917 RepID=UPI001CB88C7D|nr:E3 ubiquitin-protein ligase At1g63170-like [Erigeron canadensis]
MPEIPTTLTEITVVDEPLLPTRQNTTATPSAGVDTVTLTAVLLFLRGFISGRRLASIPSMIVLDNAEDLLEKWREDFGYLLPVVVIETIWNLAFVVVSVVMLILSVSEIPNVPVRVWIGVYGLQCVIHVVLVCSEYVRRNRPDSSDGDDTVIVASTQIRLTLTFLVSDTFLVAVYILMICMIPLAVLLCFPCLIYVMYSNPVQAGASEDDINVLPKYRFEMSNDEERDDGRPGRMVPMETNDPEKYQELLIQDVDCHICLSSYGNGSELQLLPCNHIFHAACLGKWLRQNGEIESDKHNRNKPKGHHRILL